MPTLDLPLSPCDRRLIKALPVHGEVPRLPREPTEVRLRDSRGCFRHLTYALERVRLDCIGFVICVHLLVFVACSNLQHAAGLVVALSGSGSAKTASNVAIATSVEAASALSALNTANTESQLENTATSDAARAWPHAHERTVTAPTRRHGPRHCHWQWQPLTLAVAGLPRAGPLAVPV